MHPLRSECPGEILPNILFETAYSGLTEDLKEEIRFVEAVGLNVGPDGHPCNEVEAVRYRKIFHTKNELSAPLICTSDEFMAWKQRTGASVDLPWSRRAKTRTLMVVREAV